MAPSMSPQEFVDKWRKPPLTESAGSQEHFLNLECAAELEEM